MEIMRNVYNLTSYIILFWFLITLLFIILCICILSRYVLEDHMSLHRAVGLLR